MMEIRIVTAPEGLALLETGWPTVAVSLVGDDLRFPLPSFGPHHLILRFHDAEEEVEGYVAPTEDCGRPCSILQAWARLIACLFTAMQERANLPRLRSGSWFKQASPQVLRLAVFERSDLSSSRTGS